MLNNREQTWSGQLVEIKFHRRAVWFDTRSEVVKIPTGQCDTEDPQERACVNKKATKCMIHRSGHVKVGRSGTLYSKYRWKSSLLDWLKEFWRDDCQGYISCAKIGLVYPNNRWSEILHNDLFVLRILAYEHTQPRSTQDRSFLPHWNVPIPTFAIFINVRSFLFPKLTLTYLDTFQIEEVFRFSGCGDHLLQQFGPPHPLGWRNTNNVNRR